MARASPALYARTMANTPESAHTPANRRQPDSPEQRDGQHPAATGPPAPVATPGAVPQRRGAPVSGYVDVAVKRAALAKSPSRWPCAVVEAPCGLRLKIERDLDGRQLERAWLIECRTLEAVAYVRSQVAQLMRELDGAVLSDRWERAH